MEVKIGNYINWCGPHQIADKIIWWQDKTNENCPHAERAHKLGCWLAETSAGEPTLLTKALNWFYSKRKRMQYVRVDRWDSYSADHTLALVILPVLQQLQQQKQGSPRVDLCDVPQYLHSGDEEHDNFHKRWTWVLNEMIWAFQDHVAEDPDWSTPEGYDWTALEAHQARKAAAFKLFGKYYQNLWS